MGHSPSKILFKIILAYTHLNFNNLSAIANIILQLHTKQSRTNFAKRAGLLIKDELCVKRRTEDLFDGIVALTFISPAMSLSAALNGSRNNRIPGVFVAETLQRHV